MRDDILAAEKILADNPDHVIDYIEDLESESFKPVARPSRKSRWNILRES